MWLRWLVNNLVREAAQSKFREVVSDVARSQMAEVVGQPGGSDEPAETAAVEIAFVFALGVESGGLVDLMTRRVMTRGASYVEHAGYLQDRRVIVVDSGVGQEAAARATADLIQVHSPSWIVSTGFAGALTPELLRGHVLLADRIVDSSGNRFSVGLKIDPRTVAATRGLHVGTLLTVDRLVREPDERRRLAEQYDALACDMETSAVAAVCQNAKVRFLSVRVISDGVDDRVPREIEKLLGQTSTAGKLGAAAGAIFNRPSTVKDFWKLKQDALQASDRLARFLLGVVPQLHADEQSA